MTVPRDGCVSLRTVFHFLSSSIFNSTLTSLFFFPFSFLNYPPSIVLISFSSTNFVLFLSSFLSFFILSWQLTRPRYGGPNHPPSIQCVLFHNSSHLSIHLFLYLKVCFIFFLGFLSLSLFPRLCFIFLRFSLAFFSKRSILRKIVFSLFCCFFSPFFLYVLSKCLKFVSECFLHLNVSKYIVKEL